MLNEVTEFFVKGKKNPYLPLIFTAIFAFLGLITFLIAMLLGANALIICSMLIIVLWYFGIYAVVFLVRYNRIEYEYSVLLGDFEINEIRNDSRRKLMIKCRIADMQNFHKVTKNEFLQNPPDYKRENTVVLECFGPTDEVLYNFTIRSEDGKINDVYIAHVDCIIDRLAQMSMVVRRAAGKMSEGKV